MLECFLRTGAKHFQRDHVRNFVLILNMNLLMRMYICSSRLFFFFFLFVRESQLYTWSTQGVETSPIDSVDYVMFRNDPDVVRACRMFWELPSWKAPGKTLSKEVP